MPQYVGNSSYEHGVAGRTGLLLANLGTPDAPTTSAVRRFLAEFLWDPRVVETPRWLWWLALHGVILRIRPPRSAHAYQQIWTPAGSPLLIHSRALTENVQRELRARFDRTIDVVLGMTYGNPSIDAALEQLRNAGVRRLIVIPLYPQYSATTTASVFDRVTKTLQRWRWLPELRFIASYHDEPGYIGAVAQSLREHWKTHAREHLLFSFHGAPRAQLDAGDPYHCQCLKTARLVSEALGLTPAEWSLSFQSRLGRGEWLRPYTDETLAQFATQGRKRLTVVCPGFATDNLETLEENAIRNASAFLAQGGELFDYVPALNSSPTHATMLSDLAMRHAQGWAIATNVVTDELASSRERALKHGAAR
jgi:ferrochelatase